MSALRLPKRALLCGFDYLTERSIQQPGSAWAKFASDHSLFAKRADNGDILLLERESTKRRGSTVVAEIYTGKE